MKLNRLTHGLKRYGAAVSRSFDTSSKKERIGDVFNYPVFVINLERSPYRRVFMCNQLNAHGIQPTIFKAIDGRSLNLDNLIKDGIYDDDLAHQYFSRSLSLAEIACAWSHIRVSELILENQHEMALVLEDDAILRDDAGAVFKEIMAELPEEWDMVQLFYDTEDTVRVTDHIVGFTNKPRMPIGARGYLMRLSGARKAVEGAFPIKYPADSFFGRSYRWGMKTFGSMPILVSSNDIFPTQIPSKQNFLVSVKEKIKSFAVRLLYRLVKSRGH
jgi:glycosyl transferase family 25